MIFCRMMCSATLTAASSQLSPAKSCGGEGGKQAHAQLAATEARWEAVKPWPISERAKVQCVSCRSRVGGMSARHRGARLHPGTWKSTCLVLILSLVHLTRVQHGRGGVYEKQHLLLAGRMLLRRTVMGG